jgi:hypothetical protein
MGGPLDAQSFKALIRRPLLIPGTPLSSSSSRVVPGNRSSFNGARMRDYCHVCNDSLALPLSARPLFLSRCLPIYLANKSSLGLGARERESARERERQPQRWAGEEEEEEEEEEEGGRRELFSWWLWENSKRSIAWPLCSVRKNICARNCSCSFLVEVPRTEALVRYRRILFYNFIHFARVSSIS